LGGIAFWRYSGAIGCSGKSGAARRISKPSRRINDDHALPRLGSCGAGDWDMPELLEPPPGFAVRLGRRF